MGFWFETIWFAYGINWTICRQSALHFRQITTPTPHRSIFLQARCSSWHPGNAVKALKGFPFNFNLNCVENVIKSQSATIVGLKCVLFFVDRECSKMWSYQQSIPACHSSILWQTSDTGFTIIDKLIFDYLCLQCFCLQCFDAVGWAAGRASGL